MQREGTGKANMISREDIESIILAYPICEYTFGETEDLVFSDKVWEICRTDCERYGKSWACPPNCGSLDENMRRVRQFKNFCLFSTVTETDNAWDKTANLRVKRQHEMITQSIWHEVEKKGSHYYILSTGCTTCEVCACPNEPCRHPEQRLSSMESHGMLVIQNVEKAGLTLNFGGDTVTYFSMILF